jgi:cation diffusion facilitator family transporter
MADSTLSYTPEAMREDKRRVAGNSVLAAIAITSLKIIVGVTTGSLGILSEAAHSGLDLIAAVITYFSVRVSDKPADADHQYGHGKVENFSAFIETALLLLTCIWIIYEAAKRLFFHSVEIQPSIAAFLVMFFSIAVDYWRSHALGRIAVKYDSQALEADALHFSTDIWSSSVVIVCLAVVWFGEKYSIGWLQKADPIAALFVAGVVVWVSWRLARKTIDALLDAAPIGIRNQILDSISTVDGVVEVDRARIRRAGNRYFVDVLVGMARNVTFQRAEQIADAVTSHVQEFFRTQMSWCTPSRAPGERESLRSHSRRCDSPQSECPRRRCSGPEWRIARRAAPRNGRAPHHEGRARSSYGPRKRNSIGGSEIAAIPTHIESRPPPSNQASRLSRMPPWSAVSALSLGIPEVIDAHEFRSSAFAGVSMSHATSPSAMTCRSRASTTSRQLSKSASNKMLQNSFAS